MKMRLLFFYVTIQLREWLDEREYQVAGDLWKIMSVASTVTSKREIQIKISIHCVLFRHFPIHFPGKFCYNVSIAVDSSICIANWSELRILDQMQKSFVTKQQFLTSQNRAVLISGGFLFCFSVEMRWPYILFL